MVMNGYGYGYWCHMCLLLMSAGDIKWWKWYKSLSSRHRLSEEAPVKMHAMPISLISNYVCLQDHALRNAHPYSVPHGAGQGTQFHDTKFTVKVESLIQLPALFKQTVGTKISGVNISVHVDR